MKKLKIDNGKVIDVDWRGGREVAYVEWAAGGVSVEEGAVLVLPNDIDVSAIDKDLSVFSAVIVEFPHFKDGRAYSQARRLREQRGFRAEIQARGDVGRDQVLFMVRAGINAFEAPEGAADEFAEALREFSVFYQGAADRAIPVWMLRARQALAA